MKCVISELKARTSDPDRVRRYLRDHEARSAGEDEQLDIYFEVARGRLKLRRGHIENALVHYERPDQARTRESHVSMTSFRSGTDERLLSDLEETLRRALWVRIEVRKRREIYLLDNVRFHLDLVEKLGHFVEIEAIGDVGEVQHLRAQCDKHRKNLGISTKDLVGGSYSDLLMQSGSQEE